MATKFILTLAAALLSASAAMAEVHSPQAFNQLTAPAPMAPGKAPRFVNGVSDLSVRENRHREKLPLQLSGAMKKIKKTKYAPKREELLEPKSIKRSAKAKRVKSERAAQGKIQSNKLVRKSRVKTVYIDQSKSFEEALPMPTARDNTSGF